jgi:16S rRNA (guanine527-N7)-methyltransferase
MNNNTIHLDTFEALLQEHQQKLDRFAELLIAENQKFNLTRIDSPKQIQVRHFLDSLAGLSVLDGLAQKTGKPLMILDLGSGAGFPGLVLALVRPQWHIVSLEATGKKVRFQEKVCKEIGLNNVTVLQGRGEEIARQEMYREQFDAVTARALAALPMLAELSLGFVRTGGLALYWKGPAVTKELHTAQAAVKQMGAEIQNTPSYILPTNEEDPAKLSLVVCKKIKRTPKQYPRVFGIIKKQTLS